MLMLNEFYSSRAIIYEVTCPVYRKNFVITNQHECQHRVEYNGVVPIAKEVMMVKTQLSGNIGNRAYGGCFISVPFFRIFCFSSV